MIQWVFFFSKLLNDNSLLLNFTLKTSFLLHDFTQSIFYLWCLHLHFINLLTFLLHLFLCFNYALQISDRLLQLHVFLLTFFVFLCQITEILKLGIEKWELLIDKLDLSIFLAQLVLDKIKLGFILIFNSDDTLFFVLQYFLKLILLFDLYSY